MTQKTTLLLLLAAGAGWLTLTSYSSGPGFTLQEDRSSLNCGGGGCHPANNNATVVQGVTLVDVNAGGPPTSPGQYIPGRTYAVSILGNLNPTSTSLTHFGFQTTARKADGTTVGTIDLAGTTSLRVYTGNGRTGVEHSAKIAKNSAGFFTTTWRWTAPAAGTGTVTFNTIINAVNNDGGVNGDQPNVGTARFTEAPLSVHDAVNSTALSIAPNPAKDFIHLDTRSWQNGNYSVSIFSSAGQLVSQHSVVHRGADRAEVRLPDLSIGLYAVRIQSEGRMQTAPLFIR